MADDYMDAHMGAGWTTSPGAADEGIAELKGALHTEPGPAAMSTHYHPMSVSEGHFDELLWLRTERTRLDTLLVDVLAVLEEMNSALNQHATGGRHPQAKEYHRAVMRAVKEEVKRSV